MICSMWMLGSFLIPVNASADETVIYIQENSQSILATFSSLLLAGTWKEIVSVFIAFLCVSAMVILAINHKNLKKSYFS